MITRIVLLLALTSSAFMCHSQAPAPPAKVPPVQLPEGFSLSVFASEPDVLQPIGLTFDDRGRLWIAECHTYDDAKVNFNANQRDRIVILEDTDGDGRFDHRTVFWDQAQKLTSVVTGFGGVYALCAPQLLFIPDANGDDKPDGPPQVLLDGWNDNVIRHNIVNGLKWGQDGWLYGRQGIQATSMVGAPGSSDSSRVAVNVGIWRFHPITKKVEVYAQGTTNPWGHDWDAHGEMFFINTVIGHLWHGIPGAYYKRMYGEHLQGHRYRLIDQHADHYHWDTGKLWTDSRDGKGLNDTLGGGHAHSGLMIYQGTNWPAEYRGNIFSINLHGRRLNQDKPVNKGAGFIGEHAKDIARFDDPWFRAVDLTYGPDGGVYIIDWSDIGECHENDQDGVHRETGRVYKISYGRPPLFREDLSRKSDLDLVQLHLSENEWMVRHARRLLHERSIRPEWSGRKAVSSALTRLGAPGASPRNKIRISATLQVIGELSDAEIISLLSDKNEHVRAFALRTARDLPNPSRLKWNWENASKKESAGLVRLYYAALLQRLQGPAHTALARGLLQHAEDAADPNQPAMLWHGIEPRVVADPATSLELARSSKIPFVAYAIPRRLASESTLKPALLEQVVAAALQGKASGFSAEVLGGIADGLRGWRKSSPPRNWDQFVRSFQTSQDPLVATRLREVSALFGDGRALTELRAIVTNGGLDPDSRKAALEQYAESKPTDLLPTLKSVLGDRALMAAAVMTLGQTGSPEVPGLILGVYPHLAPEDQQRAIGALSGRKEWARDLLLAIEKGGLSKKSISPFQARQIAGLGDESVTALLSRTWGEIRPASEQKNQLLAKYRAALTPSVVGGADAKAGREVFKQVCGSCHKMFGEGGDLGPDLTGSGRSDLEFLLENILDPSAVVPVDFRVSRLELKDGRELDGVVEARSGATFKLITPTQKLTLQQSDVAKESRSALSLMPDGLLDNLTENQVKDLFAFLMQQ